MGEEEKDKTEPVDPVPEEKKKDYVHGDMTEVPTREEETPPEEQPEAQVEPIITIFPGPKGLIVKYRKGLPVHEARGILKEVDSMLQINTIVNHMKALFNPRIVKPAFRGVKH